MTDLSLKKQKLPRFSSLFRNCMQITRLQEFPFTKCAPDESSCTCGRSITQSFGFRFDGFWSARQHATIPVHTLNFRLGIWLALQLNGTLCSLYLLIQLVVLPNSVLQVGNLREQPCPSRCHWRTVTCPTPSCTFRSAKWMKGKLEQNYFSHTFEKNILNNYIFTPYGQCTVGTPKLTYTLFGTNKSTENR